MAEALKDFFGEKTIARIADQLALGDPDFPRRAFITRARRGLEAESLIGRARKIAAALGEFLPENFEAAVEQICSGLGPRLAGSGGNGMAPFVYLPYLIYVAERGLDFFEASMRAQYELTQRFSAEFSIRAFLDADPVRTLSQLERWATDPSEHVRRLVSEGTRPRLPWAPRFRRFDPALALPLLEALKDDPSAYVRRSVANHLNDVAKDRPEVVVAIARRWLDGATRARSDLIRHALRTEIKRGSPEALALFGYAASPALAVSGHVSPTRVARGGEVRMSVELENRGKQPAEVLIDWRVSFPRARGAAYRKVFKGRVATLSARGTLTLERKLSLVDLTTRKHHPGRHQVELLVNGAAHPVGEFVLTEAGRRKTKTR